jgi:hypothetical protein
MRTVDVSRLLGAMLVVAGAVACSGSPRARPDAGRDVAGMGTGGATPDAGPEAAPGAGGAVGSDGGLDGGRGSGTIGAACQTSRDCACGLYCQGASPSGPGTCLSTQHGLPCAEDCDCTRPGEHCSPNDGYPVCWPTDAGICVQGGCDPSRPCCSGLCCRYFQTTDGSYLAGTCDTLC